MSISLSAAPAPAQALSPASDLALVFDRTNIVNVSVELTKGETIRLSVPVSVAISPTTGKIFVNNSYDGSRVIGTGAVAPGGQVKVFSGSSGALLQSYELKGLHSIEINRDDLREEGEPDTERIQLRIQVVMPPCSDGRQGDEEGAGWALALSFELVNNQSGNTVHGSLTKVGSGTLVLANAGTDN